MEILAKIAKENLQATANWLDSADGKLFWLLIEEYKNRETINALRLLENGDDTKAHSVKTNQSASKVSAIGFVQSLKSILKSEIENRS